mmetsp:Transcript_16792/g.46227  ORF Transcript_16792/g.46227 Transcript_16792/m.46227 type:complete len:251 (+) Transcript_16792:496-1248(+)
MQSVLPTSAWRPARDRSRRGLRASRRRRCKHLMLPIVRGAQERRRRLVPFMPLQASSPARRRRRLRRMTFGSLCTWPCRCQYGGRRPSGGCRGLAGSSPCSPAALSVGPRGRILRLALIEASKGRCRVRVHRQLRAAGPFLRTARRLSRGRWRTPAGRPLTPRQRWPIPPSTRHGTRTAGALCAETEATCPRRHRVPGPSPRPRHLPANKGSRMLARSQWQDGTSSTRTCPGPCEFRQYGRWGRRCRSAR